MPRKESKERLIEIKNNIIKNRFFNPINENQAEEKNENKPKYIKKISRSTNFRIRAEKNYVNSLNSLNSEGSMKNLSNVEGFISHQKEEIKQDQREKSVYLDEKNVNIKQNTTYKLIENKAVERQNKLDHQKDHAVKNNTNSKTQTKTTIEEATASTNFIEDNNRNAENHMKMKNKKFIEDNNQNAENHMKITNQPNSVNISVNLKPTFHLSLNSAMQK